MKRPLPPIPPPPDIRRRDGSIKRARRRIKLLATLSDGHRLGLSQLDIAGPVGADGRSVGSIARRLDQAITAPLSSPLGAINAVAQSGDYAARDRAWAEIEQHPRRCRAAGRAVRETRSIREKG